MITKMGAIEGHPKGLFAQCSWYIQYINYITKYFYPVYLQLKEFDKSVRTN